tara:strand:- start:6483 stop:7238 length:756 start_codon:yes stop_codon:yes gene_type:complete
MSKAIPKELLVVLAAYNDEKLLKFAIDSIIRQSYKNWKLVLVDDGSNDKTLTIMNAYKKYRKVEIIINKKRIGLTKCLNKVITKNKNALIARMDADDISSTKRFEKQINFLHKNKDISLLGTNANYYNESNKYIGKSNLPNKDNEIKQLLNKKNPFIHSSVVFKKSFFNELKGYNEFFFNAQDYDLWLRGRKKFKYAILRDRLIKHRIKSNITIKKKIYGLLAMILNLKLEKNLLISLSWILMTFIIMIFK